MHSGYPFAFILNTLLTNKNLKKMEKQTYVAPAIEIIEVEIEKGFAASPGGGDFGVPNGSDWYEGWI